MVCDGQGSGGSSDIPWILRVLKHLETNHQIQKLSPKCVAVLDLVGQNFEAAQADSHQKCRDQGENHIPSSEQDMGLPPMGLHHQKLGFHWILAMKTIEKDTQVDSQSNHHEENVPGYG